MINLAEVMLQLRFWGEKKVVPHRLTEMRDTCRAGADALLIARQRIDDLLEANNRYLMRARAAEAALGQRSSPSSHLIADWPGRERGAPTPSGGVQAVPSSWQEVASTPPPETHVAGREVAIRKAGQVVIDDLIDRGGWCIASNDDLADYMTRIVDACVRAALANTEGSTGGK